MKTRKLIGLTATLALLATGVMSGCQNTAEGVAQDTQNATEATAKAAEVAGEKTAQAAQKVGEGASQAVVGAEAAVKDAGKNTAAALAVTPTVKAALTADTELNDPKNKIDVDSMDGMVHLKGHVANNTLKKKAGEIANKAIKDSGRTDKVMNQLLVQ